MSDDVAIENFLTVCFQLCIRTSYVIDSVFVLQEANAATQEGQQQRKSEKNLSEKSEASKEGASSAKRTVPRSPADWAKLDREADAEDEKEPESASEPKSSTSTTSSTAQAPKSQSSTSGLSSKVSVSGSKVSPHLQVAGNLKILYSCFQIEYNSLSILSQYHNNFSYMYRTERRGAGEARGERAHERQRELPRGRSRGGARVLHAQCAALADCRRAQQPRARSRQVGPLCRSAARLRPRARPQRAA